MPEQVWANMESNSTEFIFNLDKNELTRVVQATQGGNITELSLSMSSWFCPQTKWKNTDRIILKHNNVTLQAIFCLYVGSSPVFLYGKLWKCFLNRYIDFQIMCNLGEESKRKVWK